MIHRSSEENAAQRMGHSLVDLTLKVLLNGAESFFNDQSFFPNEPSIMKRTGDMQFPLFIGDIICCDDKSARSLKMLLPFQLIQHRIQISIGSSDQTLVGRVIP